VDKKLGAARACYSGPFIAAIEWGLALDARRRPQNVDEWRSAVLRNTPVPGLPGHFPDTATAARGSAKLFWIVLGILVFFLFLSRAPTC